MNSGFKLGISCLVETNVNYGGKAAGLKRLIALGLNVPDGIAIDACGVQALLNKEHEAIAVFSDWISGRHSKFAVRSSAISEDGAAASHAGIYHTELNVESNIEKIIAAIKKVSISGLAQRAKVYTNESVATIPVVVQEMITPEISGVIFSKAIDNSGESCTYIEWVTGLGEQLVSGRVTPNSIQCYLDKDGDPILSRTICKGIPIQISHLEKLLSSVKTISSLGTESGWDIEWAYDESDNLHLLQLRPITAMPILSQTSISSRSGAVSACKGVGRGRARIIDDDNIGSLNTGEILFSAITEVDYLPAMEKSSAIVTENGGLLSHAAIVAREMDKPCIVGLEGITETIRVGVDTEVDAGNLSITQDGKTIFSAEEKNEIDWTAVIEYDRIALLFINGEQIGVEATFNGSIAYVSDSFQEFEGFCRKSKNHVKGNFEFSNVDNLTWLFEWRRFDQLSSLKYVQMKFEAAISRWSLTELNHAIELLTNASLESKKIESNSSLNQLYQKEIGAAYHALVGMIVEGKAVWHSYRDSLSWRWENDIAFEEFLQVDANDLPSYLQDMRGVVQRLAELRNWAFPFFRESNVFTGDYFSSRYDLIRDVCGELGIDCEKENETLNKVYSSLEFRSEDKQFFEQVKLLD